MSLFKNLFVILGLVLIAGLGYYLYVTQDSATLSTEDRDLSIEAESADLLAKIDSIRRISIERDLFSDPRFTSLRSFATPVPVYQVGRDNPFQPTD